MQQVGKEHETPTEQGHRLWGGRFAGGPAPALDELNRSLPVDRRLWREDVEASRAWVQALARADVLTVDEAKELDSGLRRVAERLASEPALFDSDDEDIHTLVERLLYEDVGAVAGKLHTGRSRNDQVATDVRLYLRDEIDVIAKELTRLQQGIVGLAEREADTIMPGFTHLQTAQPVTFGHHLMAWYEMLDRDYSRLMDCRRRMNQCPLGSAALAGTIFFEGATSDARVAPSRTGASTGSRSSGTSVSRTASPAASTP